jgi:putative endonuclease
VAFYSYILYSPEFHKIYIGYTSNLESRIYWHNNGPKKGYTGKYRPWSLVYFESYTLKSEALEREKYLKTGIGRTFAWEKVNEYLGLMDKN